MRYLQKILLIFVLLITCRFAFASCVFPPGQQMKELQFTLPMSISIPKDTPNGTIVYHDERTLSASDVYICDARFSRGSVDERGHHNPYGTYPIGNTGIGWQWQSSAPWSVWAQWPNNVLDNAGTYDWNGTTQGFNLVKIGTLKEGASIPSGVLGYLNADSLHTISIAVTPMAINVQTCRAPESISVNLESMSASTLFHEIYPKIYWFSIDLSDCPASISKVQYRLAPLASSPAIEAASGLIALNSTSTARGVGIQLFNALASKFDLNNKYQAGEFTPGATNYRIMIGAQYIRLPGYTIGDVRPGTANAEINFFIEYL